MLIRPRQFGVWSPNSPRRFDRRALMLRQVFRRDEPRRMLGPVDIRLGPHAWVGVQGSTRHDPELPVAADLRHGRTAIPAKPPRIPWVLRRIYKALDQVFTARPAERILRKGKVRIVQGAARFLT